MWHEWGGAPEQSDSRVMFATYDKVSGKVRVGVALRKSHVIGELMNKPRQTLSHRTRNVREMYVELQRLRESR
jgi:hypothetical protein